MSIDHEMERVGRLLAYDRDLKVDVRGTRAYSVPGRVVIPNAETYAHLGRDSERMMYGLLDHECGHARYTDHSFMTRAHKEGGESLAAIVNSLEDGRIERLMGADFVGAKQNLHKKNRLFWEDAKWRANFLSADPWSAFTVAATLYVRRSVTLAEIEAVRPEVADLLRAADAHGLAAFDAITTSAAIYQLAKQLWQLFRDPPPPPPPPPPEENEEDPSDESDDDEDEEDDAGDPSEDEPNEEPQEPQEGAEGSDPTQEPDDDEGETDEPAEGSDEGETDEPAEGSDEGEADEGDSEEEDPFRALRDAKLDTWRKSAISDNPEEAISRKLEEFESTKLYRVFSHEFDLVRDFAEKPLQKGLHEIESHASISHDAEVASSALTAAFEVALKARRECRPVGGHDEGEVDHDLLGEFATGSAPVDTIFRQFVSDDDRDVAVAILLDCSGSMAHPKGNGKDRLARRVAYALHQALATCQIEHEITGFTTVSQGVVRDHPWTADQPQTFAHFAAMRAAMIEAQEHGVDPKLFAREWYSRGRSRYAESLKDVDLLVPIYGVFKSWGATDARELTNAEGIHENLDGEAVIWQARRLAARPERRRVMFVLSDGEPSGMRDDALGAAYLKECVAKVLDAGIEVYGIGIESTAVKRYYPRHWVANSVEHLMQVAFESFVQIIAEGRTEVECVNL